MADAGIALSAENKSKKGNFRGPKNEKSSLRLLIVLSLEQKTSLVLVAGAGFEPTTFGL